MPKNKKKRHAMKQPHKPRTIYHKFFEYFLAVIFLLDFIAHVYYKAMNSGILGSFLSFLWVLCVCCSFVDYGKSQKKK